MRKTILLTGLVLVFSVIFAGFGISTAQAALGEYAHGEKKIIFVPFGFEWDPKTGGALRTEWFYENECEFEDTDGDPRNDWVPLLESFADSVGEVTNGRITIPHSNIEIITEQAFMPFVEGIHENELLDATDAEMERHMDYWETIVDDHIRTHTGNEPEYYDHIVMAAPDFYGIQRLNEGHGRVGMPDDPERYSVFGGWISHNGCDDMGLLQQVFFKNYGLKFARNYSFDLETSYDVTDFMGSNERMDILADTNIVNKLYLGAVDPDHQTKHSSLTGAMNAGVMSILSKDVYVPEGFAEASQGIFIDDNLTGGTGYAIDYRIADGEASAFMDPSHDNEYVRDYYSLLRDRLYVMRTYMTTVQREVSPGVFTEIHDPHPTNLMDVLAPGDSSLINYGGETAYVNFIGRTENSADVSLSSCRGVPPMFTASSPGVGSRGSVAVYEMTVTNLNPTDKGKDATGCGESDFKFDFKDLPSEFVLSPYFNTTFTVKPGQSVTDHVSVKVGLNADLGTTTIMARVTDLTTKFEALVPVLIVVEDVDEDKFNFPSKPRIKNEETIIKTDKKCSKNGCVDIFWEPSTDDTGVAGYYVYVDGVVEATTAATSYSDQPGYGAHRYEVQAFDIDGNVSEISDPLDIVVE